MTSAATAITAAGLSIASSGRLALALLAAAQTLGVLWLFVEGWSSARRWASATCILASVWVPLFLIASWIYAIDPDRLADVATSPEPALSIMNVALFSLIAAWLAFGGRGVVERSRRPLVTIDPHRLDRRWVLAWLLVGVVGVTAFLALTGGPVAYLSNLDDAGRAAAGLTYVVFVALALKFCGLTVLAHYWATGEGARRNVLLLVFGVMVLIGLFGQRAFIAVMLVQIVLLYTLIKRPVSVRIVGPIAILLLAAITFGVGTLKRYQNYTSGPPRREIGLVDYVQTRATQEVVHAYVSNYADGVRLVAHARTLVPRDADYERGRGFVRLALQPIPSFVRPEVRVSEPLRPLLESTNGYGYALPIPLVGYVEFGLPGVVLGGCVLGFALVAVDRRLGADRLSLPTLLVLIAFVVAIPFSLRSSIPRGVSVAALDVIGMWIVARSSVRDTGPSRHSVGS